jgi:hypothetical protein
MSGPFREAFVELEQAAFDEVKALGEQFVQAIVEVARARFVQLDAIADKEQRIPSKVYGILLANVRPTWRYFDCFVDQHDQLTLVRVTLPCRHRAEVVIDELALVRCHDKAQMCDYIVHQMTKPPKRRCYCVQQEPVIPCTTGTCK